MHCLLRNTGKLLKDNKPDYFVLEPQHLWFGDSHDIYFSLLSILLFSQMKPFTPCLPHALRAAG